MTYNFLIVIFVIISVQWLVKVQSRPLFEEINFKKDFEFNFKPIQFKPIEFAIERITPFKQFSLKHVIGKRYADDRRRPMRDMSRLPYEVYEDDLEPASSEFQPFFPPIAESPVKQKPETSKEEKPPLLHTDIGKSEPINDYLQAAQISVPEKPIEGFLPEKEHIPVVPKLPPIIKPIVPVTPILKEPEEKKSIVVPLEKGPFAAAPPLIYSLLPEPQVKPEMPNVKRAESPIEPEVKPELPEVKEPPIEPKPIESKPVESVPPVEPKPVDKPEAEAPKAVPPPVEPPNPLLRGSRLALYFGNILLEVLTQVLMSARTSLGQFTTPLAAI